MGAYYWVDLIFPQENKICVCQLEITSKTLN